MLLGVKNVSTPWPDALDFCVWVRGFSPSEGHQAGEWQLSSSPVEAPGLNVQQDFTQHQPPKIPELRATVPRREKPTGLWLGSSYPAFLPPASPVPNPGTIFRELGSSCPLSYFGWNLPWVHFAISLWCKQGHSELARDTLSVSITQGIIIVPGSGSSIEFFGELHRDFSFMT